MMQHTPDAFMSASSRRRARAGGAAAAPLWARASIARDDGGAALATEAEARTTQVNNTARMLAIVQRFEVPLILELQCGDTRQKWLRRRAARPHDVDQNTPYAPIASLDRLDLLQFRGARHIRFDAAHARIAILDLEHLCGNQPVSRVHSRWRRVDGVEVLIRQAQRSLIYAQASTFTSSAALDKLRTSMRPTRGSRVLIARTFFSSAVYG